MKHKLKYLSTGLITGITVCGLCNPLFVSGEGKSYNYDVNNDGVINVLDLNVLKTYLFNKPQINETTSEKEENLIFSDNFESNTINGWTSFGKNTKLSIDTTRKHSGNSSLRISGREISWNGPSITLDEYTESNKIYHFSGWLYHESSNKESIYCTLRFTDSFGIDSYVGVATIDANPNEWTYFEGTVESPKDLSTTLFYFESPNETLDFNIDDISLRTIPYNLQNPVKKADPEREKLTILCWNNNDSQQMVDFFCEKTGTDPSNFKIMNFDVAGSEAPEMYMQYLSDTNNDADILFLEPDWGLDFINDDLLTIPLSGLGFRDSDFSNLYDYVVETGISTTTGALKGISWQAAPGCFCYRTDLAEQFLGVKSPEEMQEKVKNWDAFLATAKTLKNANGPALSATLGGVWQAYSFSRDSSWVKDGYLVVDDYCTKYADLARTLYTKGYVTKYSQWSEEWKPLGQTNKLMGYFISTWGFGDAILTEAAGGEGGKTFGKWNCVIGPSEFYWGGTWLAPSERINNKPLAKQFIDFFTINEECATAYAEKYGEYMSNQKVMEAIIAKGEYKGAPVLGGQNQLEVLNKVAAGIDMKGKITPHDAIINNALNNAVNNYCNGTYKSIDEAMEVFKDDVAGSIIDGSVIVN